MSFVTSGAKWHRAAQQKAAEIESLQIQQADINFGKNLLSNIRQTRLAQAQQQAYLSNQVTSSTTAGAMANIQSGLAGEAGHAYDASLRAEDIQYKADLAQRYSKKGAQMDKRAATNAKIMGFGAAILSYINPALGAIAAVGNAALISGMGGDSVAQKAALSATLSGFNYAGAIGSLGSAFGSGSAAAGTAAEASGWASTTTLTTEAGTISVAESGIDAVTGAALSPNGALVGLNQSVSNALVNMSMGGFFNNLFDPLPGGRQSVAYNDYSPRGGSLAYRQGY